MSNRPCRLCFLAFAAILLFAGPLMAAPSFRGYTGLVAVPTADTLDEGDYNAAIFTLDLEEGVDSNVFAANLGLAEALEIGFAHFDPERGSGETFINAKYRFAPETAERPAFAAGVVDFTDEVDTTVYIVITRSLAEPYQMDLDQIVAPQLHLGIGGGQFDGLFAGLSAVVGERLTIMIEYDSDDINLGANLPLNDEFIAHFAILDAFDDIGLGISYNKSL
ncbi:MAG: hypothetical protein JSV79_09895 [Armatimonadota bacterium]|nr:MAG: hypothetical protein JSV79_09895 [Armatimonadota bacterium]